jgi:hypothetical protein
VRAERAAGAAELVADVAELIWEPPGQ